MRRRESNNLTDVPALYESRNSPSVPFAQLVTSEKTGRFKSIDDCPDLSYHNIKKNGGVLPYRYVQVEKYSIEAVPLSFTVTVVSPPPTFVGERGSWWPGSFGIPAVSPHPPIDMAKAAYVTNAAIAQSKSGTWDVLTTLGELRETSKMLTGLYRRVFDKADRIVNLARSNRGPGREAVSLFNEMWLEGRYGWRPLVSEIDSISRAYFERAESPTRQEGHSVLTEDLSENPAPLITPGGRLDFAGTSVRTGTRTYRGFALSTGSFSSVQLQPITTAWELVTLSFVVDRFVDIGSALQAFTPIPGVDTPASGYSVKDTFTIVNTLTAINPASGYELEVTQPHVWTYDYEGYNRNPYSATVPGLVPRLDKWFVVDLATLAVSRYGRIFRKLLT